jgi:hypothetical protein
MRALTDFSSPHSLYSFVMVAVDPNGSILQAILAEVSIILRELTLVNAFLQRCRVSTHDLVS